MRRQTVALLLLQLAFQISSCTQIRMIQGSTVQLPCFHSESVIIDANITWKFNGKDVGPTSESSGSVSVIKDGLYLSISPVTSANEGEYLCLVKRSDDEMIKKYDFTVDGFLSLDIKVTEGSDVNLPCYFPLSHEVTANALWFKEESLGEKTKLSSEDDWTHDKKVDLLYPLDSEQTIMLRHATAEDAGVYICESPEGQKLSSLNVIVEAGPDSPVDSCKDFTGVWEPCLDESSRTAEPMLQESLTEFSMKLYSFLREQHPSSNLLISPISISGLLSHLLLGASGNTRKAIERAVCVPHDFHCLHSQMKKMKEKMADSMQMASRIHYNPQMNLSEAFTTQSIQYYEAAPLRLLENSEENIRMINNWVANQTKNKITHLIDDISPNTQLVLLNAVSFSGQWKMKFNRKSQKGYFTRFNGDIVKVPLLYHSKYEASMMYHPQLKAQVARFGLTGNSSLYILLPIRNKLADLQQVEEKMDDMAVRRMTEQMTAMSPQQMEVTLPQIKLDVKPDMKILMKKLGLSSLFEGASLCGLDSKEKIVLDDAKHRALLTLTEQGVEAGAATSFTFSRSFPNFSALRPFIMLLWSDEANVPLFIGRLTDP